MPGWMSWTGPVADRRAIDAVPCTGHPGAVDVVGPDPGADPIHVPPGQWAQFVAAVKAGRYDDAGSGGSRPAGDGHGPAADQRGHG
jgi:hypothetical protein